MDKEECVICLEDISSDDEQLLSCQHKFHEKCIKRWFNNQRNCPICRFEIPRSTGNGFLQQFFKYMNLRVKIQFNNTVLYDYR